MPNKEKKPQMQTVLRFAAFVYSVVNNPDLCQQDHARLLKLKSVDISRLSKVGVESGFIKIVNKRLYKGPIFEQRRIP
jgi:hypothetical protein